MPPVRKLDFKAPALGHGLMFDEVARAHRSTQRPSLRLWRIQIRQKAEPALAVPLVAFLLMPRPLFPLLEDRSRLALSSWPLGCFEADLR